MTANPASEVSLLPRDFGSLSRTAPAALPDTLFVLGANDGVRDAPDANFRLLFGRNEPEVHVCGGPTDALVSRRHRKLSPKEKLVLVCLAQRYLRHGPHPRPLTWSQVGDELARLRPAERWSPKRAAHIVANVRRRLSGENGVPGLLEEEVPQPVGNTLNHNLITDLLTTATIVRADLRLLRP
ncbi:hypothetical protein OYE22_28730 [Streptomyces sp. 71268]|uniref:hypothetical protein n=1 Tax=Streptomyces sp. 71268 TaxID=3002640 RepID=UPI0023F77E55|nr:hypothetical protein [Streptomyces sp. 71268]WEV28722.1 hypothetical protein OYE22_28730 [Streptomyces sp. 71268]